MKSNFSHDFEVTICDFKAQPSSSVQMAYPMTSVSGRRRKDFSHESVIWPRLP